MHTIEFYEDANGKSGLSDYIHALHAEHREDFYKVAAFLDFLEENGSAGDKAICRCPEGTIYMHCIPGIEKLPAMQSASRGCSRAGPFLFLRRFGSRSGGFSEGKKVCVILYGSFFENAGGEELYVLLRHYFTAGIPRGTPFLQMYRAVRELQRYRRSI